MKPPYTTLITLKGLIADVLLEEYTMFFWLDLKDKKI
jgi:hypothetical protein